MSPRISSALHAPRRLVALTNFLPILKAQESWEVCVHCFLMDRLCACQGQVLHIYWAHE